MVQYDFSNSLDIAKSSFGILKHSVASVTFSRLATQPLGPKRQHALVAQKFVAVELVEFHRGRHPRVDRLAKHDTRRSGSTHKEMDSRDIGPPLPIT